MFTSTPKSMDKCIHIRCKKKKEIISWYFFYPNNVLKPWKYVIRKINALSKKRCFLYLYLSKSASSQSSHKVLLRMDHHSHRFSLFFLFFFKCNCQMVLFTELIKLLLLVLFMLIAFKPISLK